MKFFLEEYANHGGELKYLELNKINIYSKSHIDVTDVTEQFGVQIIRHSKFNNFYYF
ncbi:hypothetical protein C1645_753546 [Glomus cerebriforme]|uniref:Uncharacterized protein n=1 Tax=Glomus cerebriforme TaxID=658196 RepID=A0A397TFV1_9GLOM|nr:hypothetical protein C1645_753546 [Glomus cerebriforme]